MVMEQKPKHHRLPAVSTDNDRTSKGQCVMDSSCGKGHISHVDYPCVRNPKSLLVFTTHLIEGDEVGFELDTTVVGAGDWARNSPERKHVLVKMTHDYALTGLRVSSVSLNFLDTFHACTSDAFACSKV